MGALKYVLEIDSAGKNFAKATAVELGTNTEKKYTVAEFNALLGKLNFQLGETGKLDLRVKSILGANIAPLYSNTLTLTLTATPYLDVIEYPSLYIPGNYQGWAPANAAKVSSVKDDKVYEGYVNFPDATTKFKFTTAPNWDNINYGNSGTGKLSDTGGDLTVEGAGY